MNNDLEKEIEVSNEEKIALHELRLNQHDESIREIKSDIKEIKEIVVKMDKRLMVIPEMGLQCPIHQIRMNDHEKRIETMELEVGKIGKKIVAWSSVAAVILFLVSNLFLPYLIGNFKIQQTQTQTEPYVSSHLRSVTNSHP
jgi:predicted Zn-ribbon and HTH transcriptional regulator